jgi:hypothetical protein
MIVYQISVTIVTLKRQNHKISQEKFPCIPCSLSLLNFLVKKKLGTWGHGDTKYKKVECNEIFGFKCFLVDQFPLYA